jgi:hypothetical protein
MSRNIAAQAEFPRLFPPAPPANNRPPPGRGKFLQEQRIARGQDFQIALKFGKRHDFLHERRKAGDENPAVLHLEAGQGAKPRQLLIALQGKHVDGQEVQRRIVQNRVRPEKKAEVAGEKLRFPRRGANHRERTVQPFKEQRRCERPGGAGPPPAVDGPRPPAESFVNLPQRRPVRK